MNMDRKTRRRGCSELEARFWKKTERKKWRGWMGTERKEGGTHQSVM